MHFLNVCVEYDRKQKKTNICKLFLLSNEIKQLSGTFQHFLKHGELFVCSAIITWAVHVFTMWTLCNDVTTLMTLAHMSSLKEKYVHHILITLPAF